MLSLGPLGFAAPLALIGLIALPILWRLLRATPPAPQRAMFPPLRLLRDAPDDSETPHHAPWWLILMRLALAALIILALAQPVWTPPGAEEEDGPLLIVIDDGWTAAPGWSAMRRAAERRLEAAQREGRLAAIAFTASPQDGELRLDSADTALRRLDAAQARAWPTDRAALAERLRAAREAGDLPAGLSVRWLSDGVDTPGSAELSRALSAFGQVRVSLPAPGREAIALAPAETSETGFSVTALRADTAQGRVVAVTAYEAGGRALARAEGVFAPGESAVQIGIALPLDLRNRIASLRVDGAQNAGAVRLMGDRWRRPRIGLIEPAGEESQPLLSELHYLTSALGGRAELSRGELARLLEAGPAGLVMIDAARSEDPSLTAFVEEGGLLIRFAGPRLAARSDALVPVDLRAGGRLFGGALNWEDPQRIAAFDDASPFAGLAADPAAVVRRQVLAEPGAASPERIWARLEDGTPLVTAARQGRGWVVLFHVTAGPDWSDLPLSGLFPQMLDRTLGLAQGGAPAASIAGAWTIERALDGDGRLTDPPAEARPAPSETWSQAIAAPETPPGLYRLGAARDALNLIAADQTLAPLPATLPGAVIESLDGPRAFAFSGLFLSLALFVLALDALIALALAGRLNALRRSAAGLALIAMLTPADALALQEEAELAEADRFALEASLELRFAYVLTGNADIDRRSRQGLTGLSRETGARSAVEPADPVGVDVDRDELFFFPLIYWPVTLDAEPLSDAAAARVNAYMQAGGVILFDTQDADRAPLRAGAPHPGLVAVLESIDTPPLAEAPADHVLRRAFFLLESFPGRYDGQPVWVEASPQGTARDGTSSVVIGAHDWASAWAVTEDGMAAAPVEGGEAQREMARRFGINLAMYALTGNYKADQVHAAEILERLSQ